MDVERLIARVNRTVQDGSYSDNDILEYINEGLLQVAGLVPLPLLETTTILNTATDQVYVALPNDYLSHLRYVYSTGRRVKIPIYHDIVKLRETLLQGLSGGFVRGVAVSGDKLYYIPTPSTAEALQIVYHARPADYVLPDEDEEPEGEPEGEPEEGGEDDEETPVLNPDYMPPHIGPRLLHAYCCEQMFDEIEDGMDGEKVNTAKWERRYASLMGELMTFLGVFYTRPTSEMGIRDVLNL